MATVIEGTKNRFRVVRATFAFTVQAKKRFAGVCSFALGLAVLLCGIGCDRKPPSPTDSAPRQSIAEQVAGWDATVWRDEVSAREHEKTLVQLADQLRRASDKASVLAAFPFENITVPRRTGAPALLDLGIRLQRFNNPDTVTLSHAAWQKALAQFQEAGWRLVQFEWQHERFSPARDGKPARSGFAFELHGEQMAESNRFIIRGTLEVEWAAISSTNAPVPVRNLGVSDLLLLEHTGASAFNNHLLIAPEPSRQDAVVNIHPLLVLDVNGDAHDDIIMPGINQVFLNDGRAAFQSSAFISEEHYHGLKDTGVIADFNGDGKLDFLGVGERGPFTKMLILHPGSGSVPLTAGGMAAWEEQRTAFATHKLEAASAITAGDIDEDGDLDLFVAQYRPPYINGNLPTPYYDANDGYPSFLLRNDGSGKFEQIKGQRTLEAKNRRRTLAASFVDIDADGDMDLVTLNDFSGVDLFLNDGQGNFTDGTAQLSNRHLFGMGHCFADFNRDGAPDLFAIGMDIPTVRRLEAMQLAPSEFPERTQKRTDMAHGNRLYLARGGQWTEPPWATQLARSGWSWGTTAFDLDNDGDLEVYIANGHVSGASAADYDSFYWTRDIYLGSSREDPRLQEYFNHALAGLNSGRTSWNGYQHNALYMDVGTNDYLNVAYLLGVAHETDCRAVVSADLNEDGQRDLLVTEAQWQGSPNRMRHRLLVHLNQANATNHWIGVRLSPQNSIGAKVFLETSSGLRAAQVVTGDSFQSQHPSTVHFGLGQTDSVNAIRVIWPGGRASVLNRPTVDRYHILSPASE